MQGWLVARAVRAFLPWGDFAPDLGEFGHDRLIRCENVAPVFGNFYPIPKLKLGSGSSGNGLMGFHVHAQWGTDHYLYAGDLHASAGGKLYEISSDGATFTDRTRAAGGGYTADEWAFTSFGQTIIACDFNDAVQHITAGGANFADGITSTFKPRARYPFVVKGNVFMAHCNLPAIYSTLGAGNNPYLVCWSKTDAPAIYGSPDTDPQHVGAGFQQLFNDLGYITAVHGGEFGLVFQERGIIRIDGPPYTFRVISDGLTTRYPYSVVKVDEDVYFWSRSGPCVLRGGEGPAINLATGRAARVLVDSSSGFGEDILEGKGSIYDEATPPTAHEGVSAAYIPALSCIIFSGLESPDRLASPMVIYNIKEDRFSYALPSGTSNIVAFLRQRPSSYGASGEWLPVSSLVGLGAGVISAGGVPLKLATFEIGQTTSTLSYVFRRAYAQLDKESVTRILRVRPVHRLSPSASALTLTATVASVNDPDGTPTTVTSTTQDAHGWLTFDDAVEADFHRPQISYQFADDAGPNLIESHGVEIEYMPGGAYSA